MKDPSRFNKFNDSPIITESPRKDMIQLLKIKLEQLQSSYDDACKDREKFKEVISNKSISYENNKFLSFVQ